MFHYCEIYLGSSSCKAFARKDTAEHRTKSRVHMRNESHELVGFDGGPISRRNQDVHQVQ